MIPITDVQSITKAWQVDRQGHEAGQPGIKQALLPSQQLLGHIGDGEAND